MTSWPDLLDALEERTRRLAAALEAGGDPGALPEVELAAAGPLPPELALRVRVLLAETVRIEAQLRRRTGPMARAAAAYAGH